MKHTAKHILRIKYIAPKPHQTRLEIQSIPGSCFVKNITKNRNRISLLLNEKYIQFHIRVKMKD